MSFRQVVFEIELPSLKHLWGTYFKVFCIPFFYQRQKLIILFYARIVDSQSIYRNTYILSIEMPKKASQDMYRSISKGKKRPLCKIRSSDCLGHPSKMVMDSQVILILLQGLNLALSATENVTPSHEEIGNRSRKVAFRILWV